MKIEIEQEPRRSPRKSTNQTPVASLNSRGAAPLDTRCRSIRVSRAVKVEEMDVYKDGSELEHQLKRFPCSTAQVLGPSDSSMREGEKKKSC